MNKKKIYQNIHHFLFEKAQSEKYTEISEETLKKFLSLTTTKKVAKIKNCEIRTISQSANENLSYTEPRLKAKFDSERQKISKQAQNSISSDWRIKANLDDLEKAICNCRLCKLAPTRTNFVFGDGNPNAELMFIGEGPGYDEDMQGKPFVGRAGQLLNKIIEAMTFKREEVYIANVVKCRPPSNRIPDPDEASACLPFLIRQIELVKPKIIVLLGATPTKYLLNVKALSEYRGQWQNVMNIKTMPTYHPAYLLRNPSAKKIVWQDMQLVMKEFGRQVQK